jgi:putative membrane protein
MPSDAERAEAPNRTRDHLANERTFLAWIRTALALIGLGFVLARMGLFLRQIAAVAPAALRAGGAGHPGHEFVVSGVVFLALGTVLAGWAGHHYGRTRRAIDALDFEPDTRAIRAMTVLVVLGGLVIGGLVLWRVGLREEATSPAPQALPVPDEADPGTPARSPDGRGSAA